MPQIPNKLLQFLKCRHCGSWITCGPVYVLPQGSSLCGRCESVAIKQFRHTSFEALAAYFQYPCIYYPKYCQKILQWNEAVDHEEECEYQNFCSKFCRHPGTIFKSDRKINFDEESKLEYIPDFVLQHLKCSVCENYLSCTPVYVTEEGKSICHRCVSPTEPPKGAIRHYAFEILADITIMPCGHRSKGCPQYFRFGKDMLNHEMDCSYGIVYRKSSKSSNQGQKMKKERGVIETHTGHVYGTITPNSWQLFVPQAGNVKKDQEQTEFVDALRKQQERFPNVQSIKQNEKDSDSTTSIIRTPILTPEGRSTPEDLQFDLKPHPSLELRRNKVNRNGSMYSNVTPDLINELKVRQKPKKDSLAGSEGESAHSQDDSVKLYNNLDDIFWVYDEVLNEYRNSKIVKQKYG